MPSLTPLVDWHQETGPERELVGAVGRGTAPIELWSMDEQPSTGACDSSDESTEPFAVGETGVMWHLMGAGAENFVFEYRGRGTVVDTDGNEYRYYARPTDAVDGQGVLRMLDRSGLLVPMQ